jgi:hypothetical protein
MNAWRALRTVVPALSLFLAACLSGGRAGQWAEGEVVIASERVLRQAAALALEKNDFPPGSQVDDANRTLASSWKVDLQPFKGDGTRRRAFVEYDEAGPGRWLVAVRVERETNEELARPLELAHAQWEEAPDDLDAAQRILRYLLVAFAGDGSRALPAGSGGG